MSILDFCQFRFNRRARQLRLSVYQDGQTVLSAPSSLSLAAATKFALSRQDWWLRKLKYFQVRPIRWPKNLDKSDYLANKEAARKLIKQRLAFYNRLYGFSIGRIAIKNNRSRWGSCSRLGNLNFHYRLIALPEDLRDYVIVHELCHLGEFNHSSRFWRLVARAVPDYLTVKEKLKQQARLLI